MIQPSTNPRQSKDETGHSLTSITPNWLVRQLAPQGKSLRTQLLFTILPVVVAPLLIASAVGYRVVQQRTAARLQTQLANQALLTSGSTRAVLDEILTLPRTIANSPLVINEALAGSNEAEKAGLDQRPIEDLEAQFSETKLVRPHQTLNNYLQETVKTAEISEISVTNRYGFNVAYSRPTSDFVQSDEEWWQRGKDDGVWISPPDFDFTSKARTIELVQAIVTPQNETFVGVIRAVLPARKFSLLADYLKRTGISGSQRVQLIDSDTLGIIDTFSPQGFRKEEKIIGAETVEAVITELSEIEFSTDTTSIDVYVQQITKALSPNKQLKNLSVISSEDDTALVSFLHQGKLYKMTTIPGTSWVAVASMESKEITSAGQQLLLLFAVTALLLGGLTSALLVVLARQLSLPLSHLSEYSQQVAGGDLTVRATPEGTQETHVLAHTFNQLVAGTRSLLTAQQSETEKAHLFARIASAPVTSLRDIRTILEESLPTIQEILQADRVFFYRLNPNGGGTVESEVVTDGYQRAANYPNRKAIIPPHLLAEEPKDKITVINDVMTGTDTSTAYYQCMDLLDVSSSMIVSMFVDGELYGFWISHHCRTVHQWQPVEVAFVEQLAAQFQLVFERLNSLNEARESRQVSESLSNKLKQQRSGLQKQVAELTQVLMLQTQSSSSDSMSILAEDVSSEHLSELFQHTFTRLLQLTANVEHINSQLKTSLAQTEETATQVVEPINCQSQAALAMLETLQPIIQSIPEHIGAAQKALQRCRSFSGINNNLAKLNTLDAHAVTVDQNEAAEGSQNPAVFLDLMHQEINNVSEALTKLEKKINGGSERVKDAQLHVEAVFKGGQQLDQLLQGLSFINVNQLQMTQTVGDLTKLMTLSSERTSKLTKEISSNLEQDAKTNRHY